MEKIKVLRKMENKQIKNTIEFLQQAYKIVDLDVKPSVLLVIRNLESKIKDPKDVTIWKYPSKGEYPDCTSVFLNHYGENCIYCGNGKYKNLVTNKEGNIDDLIGWMYIPEFQFDRG